MKRYIKNTDINVDESIRQQVEDNVRKDIAQRVKEFRATLTDDAAYDAVSTVLYGIILS